MCPAPPRPHSRLRPSNKAWLRRHGVAWLGGLLLQPLAALISTCLSTSTCQVINSVTGRRRTLLCKGSTELLHICIGQIRYDTMRRMAGAIAIAVPMTYPTYPTSTLCDVALYLGRLGTCAADSPRPA